MAAPNSIDVLCFGTSEIFAGYAPNVTYEAEGITGYNFAISSRSAITVYYQLLYALKYQNPKIVICEFSCLYDDQLPSKARAVYRKAVDRMPDPKIKSQLIETICSVYKGQPYLSWKYPLLQDHGMWSSLSSDNFEPYYQCDST